MKPSGNVYALLIGINQYENRQMQSLRFAVRDVRAFREVARERLGLKDQCCTILTSPVSESGRPPSRAEFLRELDRFSKAPMQPEDLFILFFAGHGFSGGGASYLMTADANPGSELLVKDTAVAFEQLRAYCREIRAGNQLIIMDACRNNVTRGARSSGTSMGAAMSRDVQALAAPDPASQAILYSRAILSSCWEGQVSYEFETGEQGWFCFNLIETLRRCTAPVLDVAEWLRLTRQNMKEKAWSLLPEASDQEPHLVLDGRGVVLSLSPLTAPEPAAGVEDPALIHVAEPSVQPIDVIVEVVEMKQVAPGRFPPIPVEILELEGEVEGIKIALAQLDNDTHPSLAAGLAALAEAEGQLERLENDLWDHTPADLVGSKKDVVVKARRVVQAAKEGLVRKIAWDTFTDSPDSTQTRRPRAVRNPSAGLAQRLEMVPGSLPWGLLNRLQNSPGCSISELCEMAPTISHQILLPYIQRTKNVIKADRIAQAARRDYANAKQQNMGRLKNKLEELEIYLKDRKTDDLENMLNIFVDEHPDRREFPLEAWIVFEKTLLPRRYPFTPQEILTYAEEPYRSSPAAEAVPPSLPEKRAVPRKKRRGRTLNIRALAGFAFCWVPFLGLFWSYKGLSEIRASHYMQYGVRLAVWGKRLAWILHLLYGALLYLEFGELLLHW